MDIVRLGDDAIAARVLGGVEARVGAVDEGVPGVAGLELGHAERDRHPSEIFSGRALDERLGGDGGANMVRNHPRRLERRPGQDNRELFTAITAGDVLTLDVLLDRERDQAQHLVPGLVTISVVETLEMVDIGQDQGERPALAASLGDRALQRLIEMLAVGETRQLVGEGFVADSLKAGLEALQFGF